MSDIKAILDRHGIKRCGDSSCIFGPCGGMMTNGGCRCGHDDPGAPSRPTRLSRQLAHAVTELAAEIARLTAELAAARAVPADVEAALDAYGESIMESNGCASAVGNASRKADAAIARAIAKAIADKHLAAIRAVERIESTSKALGYSADYMAAIGRVLTHLRAVEENGGPLLSTCDSAAASPPATVGGLLATAPVARLIDEWHEDRGPALWWRFPVDEPPYSGTPLDDEWPGYHTHWTPIICPVDPATRGEPSTAPNLFSCRLCDRSGWSSGHRLPDGWTAIDNIDGPNGACPGCVAEPGSLDAYRDEYPNAAFAATRGPLPKGGE